MAHPKLPFYADNAEAMHQVLEDVASRLQQQLGVTFDKPPMCIILDPKTGGRFLDVQASAGKRVVVITLPESLLPQFFALAAHELAHTLAYCLNRHFSVFADEGFACYGAWLIGAQLVSCELPPHYQLRWRLATGRRPCLRSLWNHWTAWEDRTYDLPCSFSIFLAERFGRDRYHRFHRLKVKRLEERVKAALDVSLPQLQSDWYDHACEVVKVKPAEIFRLGRHARLLARQTGMLMPLASCGTKERPD
jgi:hypothetical protein